jgi:hypothetical protein
MNADAPLDIIEPDVAEAADYVMESWRGGVEAIIETGRRLIEIRKRWHNTPGKWSRLIGDNQWQGQSLLPFQKTHVKRLVGIAENAEARLRPHVGVLPSDTYTLYDLARLSDEHFDELVAAGVIHPAMKRTDIAAEETRQRRAASRAAIRLPDACEYRIGDARQILADVPDDSVPLILTDPPYSQEAEPLYCWLAEFAARVLIPGGSLICFTGQWKLDRDMAIFSAAAPLRYWWLLAMLHDQSQRLPGKFVIAEFKPVLWYVKNHRRGRTMLPDILRSPARDKSEHAWGQGEGGIWPVIEHLTDPGELIVDPFAGTGRWGEITAGMGRRWLGADIVEGGATQVEAGELEPV